MSIWRAQGSKNCCLREILLLPYSICIYTHSKLLCDHSLMLYSTFNTDILIHCNPSADILTHFNALQPSWWHLMTFWCPGNIPILWVNVGLIPIPRNKFSNFVMAYYPLLWHPSLHPCHPLRVFLTWRHTLLAASCGYQYHLLLCSTFSRITMVKFLVVVWVHVYTRHLCSATHLFTVCAAVGIQ